MICLKMRYVKKLFSLRGLANITNVPARDCDHNRLTGRLWSSPLRTKPKTYRDVDALWKALQGLEAPCLLTPHPVLRRWCTRQSRVPPLAPAPWRPWPSQRGSGEGRRSGGLHNEPPGAKGACGSRDLIELAAVHARRRRGRKCRRPAKAQATCCICIFFLARFVSKQSDIVDTKAL